MDTPETDFDRLVAVALMSAIHHDLRFRPENTELPELIVDVWERLNPELHQRIAKTVIEILDYEIGYPTAWQQVLDMAFPQA